MLGFGGHFATKSRTYSTTFGALRQERADFNAKQDPYTLALGEATDLIVINHWAYAGRDDCRAPLNSLVAAPLRDPEGGQAWISS